jgi:non-canonical (house-cleaning) NTP pyrophosphatase
VGDEETRLGAEARARAALAVRDADLGFGLEGGVVYDGPRTWLISWVAAVARDGRVGHASGLRMVLPDAAGPRLRAGEELAVIVDDLFRVQDARSASGAIGLLTEGAVSRTEAFAQLVAMALAPHLRPDLYR